MFLLEMDYSVKCAFLVVLIIITIWGKATCSDGAFICRSISDSCGKPRSFDKSEERITALEEQVKTLQQLVASAYGNVTSLPKDIVPTDCAEIYENGVRTDGVYLISPDGRCPFLAYCDMTSGGWTLIQRRQDGSVNFYKPWDDYVIGFGNLEGEHWLGLEKTHRLTKTGSQILFHIGNYDDSVDHAHYKVFTVHDATTAYRMNVDTFGYTGTIKEQLSYHDNMKFSTFDRDNDKGSGNCCKDHLDGGGWWYKSCYEFGNFNGLYGKREPHGMGYYPGPFKAIKNVHIKVKRRNALC